MPVKIFFCHAHEDEKFLNKLKAHLSPLKRQGLIEELPDRDFAAGTEWDREINKHLNSADIILLLVSPDFMNSKYIQSIEVTRALDRHQRGEARVIPVILRHVLWQVTPIGKLQALPKDGKPMKSWADQDEAYFDVAKSILEILENVLDQKRILQGYTRQIHEVEVTLEAQMRQSQKRDWSLMTF